MILNFFRVVLISKYKYESNTEMEIINKEFLFKLYLIVYWLATNNTVHCISSRRVEGVIFSTFFVKFTVYNTLGRFHSKVLSKCEKAVRTEFFLGIFTNIVFSWGNIEHFSCVSFGVSNKKNPFQLFHLTWINRRSWSVKGHWWYEYFIQSIWS